MSSEAPSILPVVWPTLTHLPRLAPAHLKGETGSNRADPASCLFAVQNDYEAIQRWLNRPMRRGKLLGSYQKAVERLLLWCVFQHKKEFSSLTLDDFEAYFIFIADPQPADAWCGRANGHHNTNHRWKPFSGPLSVAAQQSTHIILHSLMSYLVQNGYLKMNPLSRVNVKNNRAKKKAQDSFFPMNQNAMQLKTQLLTWEEWEAMLETLEKLPEKTIEAQYDKYRLRCMIEILYFSQLRVNDLAKQTWSGFYQKDGAWYFAEKEKSEGIAVHPQLLSAIQRYRIFLGFTPLPTEEDNRPIIQRWRGKSALRAAHMNRMLKTLALQTASRHFLDKPLVYQKLKGFSAIWLRHFSISTQEVKEKNEVG